MSSNQSYRRVSQTEESVKMPPPPADDVPPSRAMVVGSVLFYLVAAIIMVMVNKWVLNAVEVPLFFLFCQLVIAVLLLQLCAVFGYFKLPRLDTTVCKGLVPLISCNVLGLAFNTYCLQYVDASFYQIARGLVLPFTVFFSWLLLRTRSSAPTLIAIGLVCIGFMLGVSAENIHASALGIALGVASSVTTSVHAIVVKNSLPIVGGNTLDLVWYSNLLSAIIIFPVVLVNGEIFVVMNMVTVGGPALSTFLTGATVTGIFGFLICIAGFLSIKVTSPVSHMISAAVRGVLQTFLGIWLFGDKVGSGRAGGIVFILGGSIYYVSCANCRKRKARCDLGDLDAPHEPPCTRCRREGAECTFLPSRRGGQRPFNAGKRKRDPNLPAPPGSSRYYAPVVDESEQQAARMGSDGVAADVSVDFGALGADISGTNTESSREGSVGPVVESAMGLIGSLTTNDDNRAPDQHIPPPFRQGEFGRNANVSSSSMNILPPPISTNDIFQHTRSGGGGGGGGVNISGARSSRSESTASPGHSLERGASVSDPGGKRRRVDADPMAATTLTTAIIRNPVDALELLSQAATREDAEMEMGTVEQGGAALKVPSPVANPGGQAVAAPRLEDFPLTLIHGINMGKMAPVGAVEALLMLSEYLPRLPSTPPSQLNAEENRLSWMLVGSAVRLACTLGIDQVLNDKASPSKSEEVLNREKTAWTSDLLVRTYRTGKAFWLRGHSFSVPGEGGPIAQATKKFPSLRFIPDVQDDFASLIQAYLELTQILSSAHNVFHQPRDRASLNDQAGLYSKYLDEFARSLDGFKNLWQAKRWATFPLTECVWITYHYVRLYINGFAFQAHIQRATTHDAEEPEEYFPEGVMVCPDGQYILEAIDAAADLLRLVTDRLHPGGALPYLPRRFFLFFAYAGVFLLRAVHVEAVTENAQSVIIRLLRRLIFVLACASTDDHHPGVRFARLLNGLVRAFHYNQDSTNNTAAPTRRSSPQPGLDGLFDPTMAFTAPPSTQPLATPFPMLPFEPSQNLHQVATALDGNSAEQAFNLEDLDLGLMDPSWYPPVASQDFGIVLDNPAADFWPFFESKTDEWGWLAAQSGTEGL
ncbi:DUF250 domain contaning protein [Pseudohyphozyma bogoriensis]|nr:DUF250 domain contaning protein [Pseudohyphozyma bogoriensis]